MSDDVDVLRSYLECMVSSSPAPLSALARASLADVTNFLREPHEEEAPFVPIQLVGYMASAHAGAEGVVVPFVTCTPRVWSAQFGNIQRWLCDGKLSRFEEQGKRENKAVQHAFIFQLVTAGEFAKTAVHRGHQTGTRGGSGS